jgi:DNA-binding winged helix-turn-helix (wHTH) protein/Tol biopolymer transport system component
VSEAAESSRLIHFESFEVNFQSGELRRAGERVRLPEQSFQILAMLLERPGEVVMRQEIQKRLWPNDTVVEFENSINAAVKRLRLALGDSADEPRYVETLARRGYRWMVPVEWVDASPNTPQDAVPAVGSPPAESSAPNLTGRKVSHYRVLEILGGGGMGVIYKAEDLKLGRQVALKFLPEELGNDARAVERFEREARAASALDHPNICSIYEFGEHEGQPFIVMQLLEGQTLRERIGAESQPGKPLPTGELLDLAIQVMNGLEAAHQKGIIHRDIKPANIFITNRGEAKILDFGVAKLVECGQPRTPFNSEHTIAISPDSAPTLPDLTLTGANLGTAGYMSPEQILGEKLDTRSDLFSFGLVLYEMATGKRAFSGDFGLDARENIRNPGVPAKLEKIIDKAVKKDREARYQTAAEMRADLSNLIEGRQPRPAARRWALVLGVAFVALLVTSVILRLGRVRPPAGLSSPEPKLRQLTTNSFENRVLSGAISPDGKYLAYTDANGIRLELVATGETRVIPQPEELEGKQVYWEVVGTWFPDSTRFIANAHPASVSGELNQGMWDSVTSSMWAVSVLGGPPQKLRDNAGAYSVSPDGSLVSFGTNKGKLGDREIWLIESGGDNARKLFDTDEESSIFGLSWSGDGKRVLYVKTDKNGDTLLSRDLKGGPPATVLSPGVMKRVNDLFWLADGRLVYSVSEPESFLGSSCNFWEMPLDRSSGKPVGKPRQFTNWSGFCMSDMSVTADGKKLAFVKSTGKQTSFLAQLGPRGTSILAPRHFPLKDSSVAIVGWMANSKAIFFISKPNQSGYGGIYRQPLDQDIAEPVVTEGYGRNPCVTPDGKSIVYLGIGVNGPWPARGPEPVMRVSINGGPSLHLFTAKPYSVMSCARSPSALCVIAEPTDDGKQLVVSALDLVKGRGPELFRFALVRDDDSWFLDISPDGTRVAVTRTQAGPIYILSLTGKVILQTQVKGWSSLQSFFWAADGKSLFVTAAVRNGREVLHVDLQGNAHALWENTGGSGEAEARPSPDGRYLAFDGWTTNGNMWTMENF